jgi:hypothetical protein
MVVEVDLGQSGVAVLNDVGGDDDGGNGDGDNDVGRTGDHGFHHADGDVSLGHRATAAAAASVGGSSNNIESVGVVVVGGGGSGSSEGSIPQPLVSPRSTERGRLADLSDDSGDEYQAQTSMLHPRRKPRSRLKKFFTSLLSLSSSDEDDYEEEAPPQVMMMPPVTSVTSVNSNPAVTSASQQQY